jgi:hypothetical protein
VPNGYTSVKQRFLLSCLVGFNAAADATLIAALLRRLSHYVMMFAICKWRRW